MSDKKPQRIEPTEELLERLVHAQAKHTAAILTDPYNRFGDDWGDYTTSALDVMTALANMRIDQRDLDGLDVYLNTPKEEADQESGFVNLPQSGGLTPHLYFCASDGICPEIYELNCISMYDPELEA
jgi:hypothetical protein